MEIDFFSVSSPPFAYDPQKKEDTGLGFELFIYQGTYLSGIIWNLEGLFDLVLRKVSQTKPEAGSRGRLLLAEVKE